MSARPAQKGLKLEDLLTDSVDLRGRILLLDIWSYTDLNCLDRLPFTRGMWARYGGPSFLILGVHIPEQDFARGREMLEGALSSLGLDYANLSDDERLIWTMLGRPAMPSRFLFDQKGALRFVHSGQGGEQEMEAWVIRLLRETGAELPMAGVVASRKGSPSRRTEVIHCGALQGDVGNDAEGEALKVCTFQDDTEHEMGLVYLGGEWMQELQYLEHVGQEMGHLALRFAASGLYAILSSGTTAELEIALDGGPVTSDMAGKDISFEAARTLISVGSGRLLHLLDRLPEGPHEVVIKFASPGTRIFSFTCVL